VGQGLIDRTKKAGEQADKERGDSITEHTEQAETAVTMAPPEPAEAIEESESDFEEVASDTAGHTQPVVTKTGEESTPRYRPRMRFGDS
jgi:hypothetical protein